MVFWRFNRFKNFFFVLLSNVDVKIQNTPYVSFCSKSDFCVGLEGDKRERRFEKFWPLASINGKEPPVSRQNFETYCSDLTSDDFEKVLFIFSNFISFVLRLASLSCRWAPRETSSRPKFSPFSTFKIGHNYLGHKHLVSFSKYARQKKSQTEIDSYLSANRHSKIILFFDHFSNF